MQIRERLLSCLTIGLLSFGGSPVFADCPPEVAGAGVSALEETLSDHLQTVSDTRIGPSSGPIPPRSPGIAMTWADPFNGYDEASVVSHPALVKAIRASGVSQLSGDDVYLRPGGSTLALFEKQIGNVEGHPEVWQRFYRTPVPYREFRNSYFGAARKTEELLAHVTGLSYQDLSDPMHVARTAISYVRGENERPQALIVSSDICVRNGAYSFPQGSVLQDSARCEGRRFRTVSTLTIRYIDSRGRFQFQETGSALVVDDADGTERVFSGSLTEIRRQFDRQR